MAGERHGSLQGRAISRVLKNRNYFMSEYEGFGANTTGGFGGELKSVTTLDDSGPGSLRSIVDSIQSPTIINFNVSGTIRLNDFLYIPANVTIDGEYKVIVNNKGFILPYYNNIFERLYFFGCNR